VNSGDVYVTDVGAQTRRLALVVSGNNFHRWVGRALVAPGATGLDPDDPFVITVDGTQFALHRLVSVPEARLLEQQGSASPAAMRSVHRAVRATLT
jgi:mRNA-degrading endonuclease toxin of MazEF toxin-antitoxin module